jgi:hypothetical protein
MTTIVSPHVCDLGSGFQVQRLLRRFPHKMVGPFIFDRFRSSRFCRVGASTYARIRTSDSRRSPTCSKAP